MDDGTSQPEELPDALAQHPDQASTLPWVSTGTLPSDEAVRAIVEAGYERFRDVSEGEVADYIPALAEAAPETFGVCLVGVRGRVFEIGDAAREFTILSVSRLLVSASV